MHHHKLVYSIGGVSFAFQISNPTIRRRLEQYYRHYTASGSPDIHIEVKYEPGLKRPTLDSIIFQARNWKFGKIDERFCLIFPDKGKYFYVGYLDTSMKKILLYTKEPSGRIVENFFPEFWYSLLLPKTQSLMLHGCGVVGMKKAYLFLAASGGGKSTIAKLALKRGLKILNDETIVIRKEKRLYKIYGTPWSGNVRYYSNGSHCIKEFFFLRKNTSNKIEPMTKVEAMVALLRHNHCIPVNQEIISVLLDTCQDLSNNIKCYWMDFKPDDSFWRIVDGVAQDNS